MRVSRSGRRSPPDPFATGWYAVLALAVVAALGAAMVVGAGMSLWRGSSVQRAVGVPVVRALLPSSGVVTVPLTHRAAPRHPHVATPPAPSTPALPSRAVQPQVVARPGGPQQASHQATHQTRQPSTPAPSTPQTPPAAVPTTSTPTVTSPQRPTVLVAPLGIAARAQIVSAAFRGPVSIVLHRGRPPRVGLHLTLQPAWNSSSAVKPRGHAYGRRCHHDDQNGDEDGDQQGNHEGEQEGD